jgi:hypothetical protein
MSGEVECYFCKTNLHNNRHWVVTDKDNNLLTVCPFCYKKQTEYKEAIYFSLGKN